MFKIIPLLAVAFFAFHHFETPKKKNISNKKKLFFKEDYGDWQLLFDGKTTNGWHTYGKKSVGKVWKTENGILHLDPQIKKLFPSDGGDLVTNLEYENFDLKLEWKISKNGNSGVIIFVNEDTLKYKEPYFTGPEMQVLDNDGHPDGKIFKHHAGDLYDLVPSSVNAVKPVGGWNAAEIIANKGKLDFYLNGKHVVSTTMWNDDWRKMVAGSKFKAWPDFGIFKKGRIDLQDHGDEVWFKNIKIKRL